MFLLQILVNRFSQILVSCNFRCLQSNSLIFTFRTSVYSNGRFYTRGRIICLLFVWLFFSSIETGTRRIMRQDELSSVVRLERRTTENSSSRRVMRLVPVFILQTNNQTNHKCLPKFVQTDNESSNIKTANERI